MSKTIFGTMNEKGEVTKTLEVDISSLSSSDPLAFAYGISRGKNLVIENNKKNECSKIVDFKEIHESNYKELTLEYLRGFKLGYTGILLPEGTKIPKGTERSYFDCNKNILKDGK